MNPQKEWIEKAIEIIREIERKEMKNIERASITIAESMFTGHVCYLFGSGHSTIPVEEMYPRYGGVVGFLPIIQLPLSHFTNVVGDLGVSQFQFLERSEGYAEAILQNYVLHSQDSIVIYSNSGVTPIVVDMALAAKKKNVKLIAVTSLSYSKLLKPWHSSGKKLHEIADVVIDSCVPPGDVAIEISGFNRKVGPLSTAAFVTIANLISIGVIQQMVKMGLKPRVNPVSYYDHDAEDVLKENIREFARLLSEHLIRQ